MENSAERCNINRALYVESPFTSVLLLQSFFLYGASTDSGAYSFVTPLRRAAAQ